MKCTYCGGTKFFKGPSGGLAVNVLCANKECRHWFNNIFGELTDLDSIEPTDEEKEQEREKRENAINLGSPRMLVKIEDIYQEGRRLFASGDPSRSCFQEAAYGGYAAAQSNMIRLSGWIDAALNRGEDR